MHLVVGSPSSFVPAKATLAEEWLVTALGVQLKREPLELSFNRSALEGGDEQHMLSI